MPTILVNPNRAEPKVPRRAGLGGDGPRPFHRRLPGYAPTPLAEAPGGAADLGLARLWVKDESSRLGLPAFKILGASWAIYRLVVERLGHEPQWRDLDELRAALASLGPLRFVAATDGNHGRAVAHTASLLGYESHILVPAGTAAARIAGIESEGAAVTVVDGTYDDAVVASAEMASSTTLVVSDTSWPGYTDVPANVIAGYDTIFAEVDDQLAGSQPDIVVVQMGVGALAAAVVAHYEGRSAIVGVEPDTAACNLASAAAGRPVTVPGPHRSIMAGLNCGNVSMIAWPLVSRGVDVFVAIDDAAAEQAMRDLAGIGMVAGETGASGLAGLGALAAAPPGSHPLELAGASVLVLCTEGATDPEAYERIVSRVAK
ncbi:MAG: Pyridoxal-5-phosphate-dependent enzyme beta subunit [Actinomycetia bacterium]|nr:Pyridoxal-5-phosphate-dependent enzyme beta subunit [Actinomycetes bacterium]